MRNLFKSPPQADADGFYTVAERHQLAIDQAITIKINKTKIMIQNLS